MLHIKLPAWQETILETLKCYTHLLSVCSMIDFKIRFFLHKISFRLVLSFLLPRGENWGSEAWCCGFSKW